MAKRSARVLILGLAALGLATLAGGGSVWAHYRSTPTFREWARATPVDDVVWRAHVPAGVELGRGASWRSDDGPPRERFGQWRARFTVEHGETQLLDLEVEVRVESREVEGGSDLPSEAFEGIEAFVTERGRDPDFHGVCVLSLRGLATYVDGGALDGLPQGPRMQLDVFALAGPGPAQLVVQDVAPDGATRPGPLLGAGAFASPSVLAGAEVLVQMLSLEDPPAEGLAYQARSLVFPNWTTRDGRGSSAGVGNRKLAATTRLYSAEMKLVQALRCPFDPGDHFGFSMTDEVSRNYQWNGEVW